MRMMFPPQTPKDSWESMNHDLGAYASQGQPTVFQDDGKDAFIRVPITFAHRVSTLQIVCSKDAHGQINSLAFLWGASKNSPRAAMPL